MRADELDDVYGTLSEALGRTGERQASLFLATLALDLITGVDRAVVVAAIERAERLART